MASSRRMRFDDDDDILPRENMKPVAMTMIALAVGTGLLIMVGGGVAGYLYFRSKPESSPVVNAQVTPIGNAPQQQKKEDDIDSLPRVDFATVQKEYADNPLAASDKYGKGVWVTGYVARIQSEVTGIAVVLSADSNSRPTSFRVMSRQMRDAAARIKTGQKVNALVIFYNASTGTIHLIESAN